MKLKNKKITFFRIIFLLAFAGLVSILYYLNSNRDSLRQVNLLKETIFGISKDLSTATFYSNKLHDEATVIYYADGKTLYKYKLDGQLPTKIAEFDNEIFKISAIPFTQDVYITTLKVGPNKYSSAGRYWLLKEGLEKSELLRDNSSSSSTLFTQISQKLQLKTFTEYIYPEKSGTGVNIMSDTLDGSTPKKIGFLAKPIIKQNPCEFTDCTETVFPYGFIPSYNREYLLNQPSKGGGPGIVISGDGTKVYSIDFYWYVSWAVWISENQLLTSDQNGKKLFTFKPDGTFSVDNASSYLHGEFEQKFLSPFKNYLILQNGRSTIELLNIKDKSVTQIDHIDKTNLMSDYKLKEGEVKSINIGILGWNKTSDKIVYGVFISLSSSDINNPSYKKVIKIFDLNTKKSYKIAELKPNNQMDRDLRLFGLQ